ncbi:MAG: aspartate-semialdehyde dehydrogenase [Sphaerobacter sp.]|nr:aspartate-semialdehyde dehydrogenase [Sphaerobacter sp.]
MGDRIEVAVLGATGSVGQRFVQLLDGHPWFRVAELVGSERSAGQRYGDVCDWRISAAPPAEVADIRVQHYEEPVRSSVVFSALPGGIAGQVEASLAAQGKRVFTNARDTRMQPDVPLMIPEVNPDHAAAIRAQRERRGWKDGFIVANPNCSTIHLVLALKPIWDAFGIEQAIVTTLQAASGAGYPGVPSMDLIDNVVPFIGGEEEKIETETRKLLGDYGPDGFRYADITLSATCTRVPVRDGHTEAVSLKLRRAASVDDVVEVLANFRGRPQELSLPSAPTRPVVVRTEADRPQPVLDRNVERGMASIVGRVRACNVFDVRFVVLGHNTIRGAAGASILNAELLRVEGYLD